MDAATLLGLAVLMFWVGMIALFCFAIARRERAPCPPHDWQYPSRQYGTTLVCAKCGKRPSE